MSQHRMDAKLKQLGFKKNRLNDQLHDSLASAYACCQHHKLVAYRDILLEERYRTALKGLRNGHRAPAISLLTELTALAARTDGSRDKSLVPPQSQQLGDTSNLGWARNTGPSVGSDAKSESAVTHPAGA